MSRGMRRMEDKAQLGPGSISVAVTSFLIKTSFGKKGCIWLMISGYGPRFSGKSSTIFREVQAGTQATGHVHIHRQSNERASVSFLRG